MWSHLCWSPLWKTEYMMKAFMQFHDESQKAVSSGQSWTRIRKATGDIQHQLRSMKFELPGDEEAVSKKVGLCRSSFEMWTLLTLSR